MKLICVLLACSLSGCSVAGYLAGSEIDRRAPEFDTLTTIHKLEPGDQVTVLDDSGNSTTGTVVEPIRRLTFEQKVERITGASAVGFDVATGSFSSATPQSYRPVATNIVLRKPGQDDVQIPTNSIARIIVPNKRNAAFTGLVLGTAVDVAVVVIISSIKIGPMFSWR